MLRPGNKRRLVIRRPFHELQASATFSLRWFLLITVSFAILCGLREFAVAILIALFATVYYSMLGSGSFAAKLKASRNNRQAASMSHDSLIVPVLFAVTICSLFLYRSWHSFIHMASRDPVGDFFTPPVVLGLSLYRLQRLIHILLHIAIYLAWLGNCWTSGRVAANDCRTASAASFLLFCSYVADPLTVDWIVSLLAPTYASEPLE